MLLIQSLWEMAWTKAYLTLRLYLVLKKYIKEGKKILRKIIFFVFGYIIEIRKNEIWVYRDYTRWIEMWGRMEGTRWSGRAHSSGCGYKEWESVECFGNLIVVFGYILCNILYGTTKSFSLNCECRCCWSNHVKTLCTFVSIVLSFCELEF